MWRDKVLAYQCSRPNITSLTDESYALKKMYRCNDQGRWRMNGPRMLGFLTKPRKRHEFEHTHVSLEESDMPEILTIELGS